MTVIFVLCKINNAMARRAGYENIIIQREKPLRIIWLHCLIRDMNFKHVLAMSE